MVNRSIQAVGLDIGTSKVRCIIGEVSEDGKLNIIGIGEAESRGLRRGVVTTTETVAESIKKAVDEAEKMSGVEVEMVTVNLSGEHLQGANKSGVVAVAGIEKEISNEDVERAIESASAMSLPAGWEIVDKLPQEFIIDGQDGIIEPVGMKGSRLESRVHVVTGPSAGRQNTVKAINSIGLEIEYMMLEPLAAAEAVLTDDDKEYGCAVVNMGAEITNLMIFGRGAVQHTAVFPFGGMHFTKDIAVGLRVSIPEADRIKRDHGCVAKFLMSTEEKQQIIEITPVGRTETRQLTKEILCDIMQPRAIELLQHIAEEVRNAGHQISSGVILTGGSVSIRGIVELAEQVFDAPTRIGQLEKGRFEGLLDNIQTPEWAVACGLVYSSFKTQVRENRGQKSPTQKVAQWFENFREKFR
jgi:cell division protein FtsA